MRTAFVRVGSSCESPCLAGNLPCEEPTHRPTERHSERRARWRHIGLEPARNRSGNQHAERHSPERSGQDDEAVFPTRSHQGTENRPHHDEERHSNPRMTNTNPSWLMDVAPQEVCACRSVESADHMSPLHTSELRSPDRVHKHLIRSAWYASTRRPAARRSSPWHARLPCGRLPRSLPCRRQPCGD